MLLLATLIPIMALGIEAGAPLPGTEPLTIESDLAAHMVAGIDAHLMDLIERAPAQRAQYWNRDFSSHDAYARSIKPNRERFRKIIGAVDKPLPPFLEVVAEVSTHREIARGANYSVLWVRWPVFKNVLGEGLLLEPDGEPIANIVAILDADSAPGELALTSESNSSSLSGITRLARSGCRVLIPELVNRHCTYSGHPDVRMTSQPHREYVYRGAYEMGRHIIGYEVQKVRVCLDWFHHQDANVPIGIFGYGEGGLIAFYTSAVDTRVDVTAVSGYFGSRQNLWQEPIYRNVWSLLIEFGDAGIASLIAPRTLLIEPAVQPDIQGPPPPSQFRRGAAPGKIETPSLDEVRAEALNAKKLVAGLSPPMRLEVFPEGSGDEANSQALSAFIDALIAGQTLAKDEGYTRVGMSFPFPEPVGKHVVDQLMEHTQRIMHESHYRRAEFWARADASSLNAWQKSTQWYRDYLWDEVIGRLPPASVPANPRTRQVFDEPKYLGYEVVLDVYPDVIAQGILLLPKDIKEGERRPVVVCQHGLEGTPRKAADPTVHEPAYNQYACRLAERGFVVYAPQNPYIGGDDFRVLQRKANPLGLSLFSFIVRQHERTLEWLGSQPFVDPQRIALYGISYGGKTAMRVPALLDGYCLSICSADFNEWIWKNVSNRAKYSYLFTGEYEMFEFGMGETFNYAELSWLILPRPFMVERGHHDGVAPDSWVAYEYARTRQKYVELGVGDKTTIEYFNGPHAIHGVGTFEFLHKHLDWPVPEGN